MGSLGQTLELNVLDHMFGKTTYTAPVTHYIALFTLAPTSSGGGTEVTGGSYARVAVTNNTTNWSNATTTSGIGRKVNGTTFTFPAPTANWGTVVAFAVMASSAGVTLADYIAWGSLSPSKTINNGDGAPSFAAGSLVITAT